jgi:hypothetical protein
VTAAAAAAAAAAVPCRASPAAAAIWCGHLQLQQRVQGPSPLGRGHPAAARESVGMAITEDEGAGRSCIRVALQE